VLHAAFTGPFRTSVTVGLRILSLRYPKSMKPERRDVARGAIICRLSKALRIRPQVLAPDLPELPPSPNPPAGPPRSLMGEITAGLMPHGRGAASFARSKTHWIWRLPDMARKNHRNRTAFLKTPTARNKYAVRRWKRRRRVKAKERRPRFNLPSFVQNTIL
jgi:hypothetical protein